MRVRVRLFAIQRELAGAREVELELPAGSSIEGAWAALVALHPSLAPGRAYVRFARNADYADADTPLADGDELAIIPPVSGGAERRGACGSSSSAMSRSGHRSSPSSATVWPRTRTGRSSGSSAGPASRREHRHRDRKRRRPGTRAVPSSRSATRPTSRWPSRSSARSPTRSRSASAWSGSPSSTGRAMCRSARRAWRSSRYHRIGTPRSTAARYAIDETKARAPIWKAERFADGHVWVGEPARDRPAAANEANDASEANEEGR